MGERYHLYSIGNALVDIDFKVTPELLDKHQFEKGSSSLMNHTQMINLLADLSGTKAKACAGSAVNTTILLAQLGGKGFYSGRIADDDFGEIFYTTLKEEGVQTNIPEENRQHGATGTCVVMVTPDTDRTMKTYLGVGASFSAKDLDEAAIAQSDYFYVEGYLVPDDNSFQAALHGCQIAKQYGRKIALTLSDKYLVHQFGDRFQQILDHGVDILFCNEMEARAFGGSDDIHQAANNIKQRSRTFAITLGPEGAIAFDGERIVESPAHDVKTIDSVGAGDTFAGSFIYSLAQGFDFEKASEVANFASGLVVAKYGPRLDENEIAEITALIDKLA